MSHHVKALFACCSLALLAGTASGNVLLNPGYESGAGTDAADWAEITAGPAGSTTRSTAMPNSGGAHAYMQFDHIANPPAGGAYFIEQNQAPGSINNALNYNLSFFAKVDSADFTGMDTFVQILWLDQDGSDGGGVKGEMLTSLIGLGISTSYQQFSFLDMDAPDGADSFLLRFQISAGAVGGIANGLSVDDASLAVVPTPASLTLLAMGGALVAKRRRRTN